MDGMDIELFKVVKFNFDEKEQQYHLSYENIEKNISEEK